MKYDREINMNNLNKEKILLILLPFWTPMIPPLGITNLKSYLQAHGFVVKTADANIETDYKEIYDTYFDCLRQCVPEEKRGNFFSIGTDVLRNHLMVHIHCTDERTYVELVKILINRTYYINVDDSTAYRLIGIVVEFYAWLRQYVYNLLEKEKPGVLGLSVYKDILPASMFVFKITRERFPHIKTVMGGSVFSEQLTVGSPDLEFFLEKTKHYIDHLLIGPAELLFLKYLNGDLRGLSDSQRVYTAQDIGGEMEEFSSLDIPDYSDIDISKYPYLGYTGSLSCPYQCSFCNVVSYFGKYKQKDVSQIADEMQRLYHIYGSQVFYFSDNMVNPYIFKLAEENLKRDKVIYWSAYLKVDDYGSDPANTMQWRRGGFYHARLGLDSGSQHILDMMDKRITPAQSKAMIAGLAHAGIKTTTYWLVGHPGETEADFQETLDFLSECKNDIWEAECEYFNYNYSGQSHSQTWSGKRVLVYPADARDMLIVNKWGVDGEPSREVIMNRVCRFVDHCKKLGIPNPYSLHEIHQADLRWQRLHPNAATPLIEFRGENVYIDECRYLKELHFVKNSGEFSGDFEF